MTFSLSENQSKGRKQSKKQSPWTQLKKVVYGATDEKRGFAKHQENLLHPKTEIVTGIMANEASSLLKDFFQNKRN